MTIETQTLLYHMQKNRLTGMSREEAIGALSTKDENTYIDQIRISLCVELQKIDDATYFAACKEAIFNHVEEDK